MKLKLLQKQLIDKKLDATLLFFKDPNFFYFVQEEIENSFLLIPSKGQPLLFVNQLEDVKVKMKKVIYKDVLEDLKLILTKQKIKNLGLNYSTLTIKQHKFLSKLVKTKDEEGIFQTLRRTKTPEEIKKIGKAISFTEKTLSKIVKNFNFKTEKEIKDFIKIEALKQGCGLAFEPVVASGRGAAIPHYSGSKALRKGFLIIDMGFKFRGYCADITRTLFLGKPSIQQLDVYNKLLSIHEEVIKQVKPGKKVSELEEYVRQKLGSEEKHFIHSLGHGVGIDVHEFPVVSQKSKDVLEEGMVITIEPGIYKDFGIRIEDDILVTKNGCKVLTKFTKQSVITKF